MENIFAQSRGCDRDDRYVRGPTASFDRLFAFLVVGHGRRQLLWFEVTASDG
jgi:hypothetical protein